jgi:hypothetical protein
MLWLLSFILLFENLRLPSISLPNTHWEIKEREHHKFSFFLFTDEHNMETNKEQFMIAPSSLLVFLARLKFVYAFYVNFCIHMCDFRAYIYSGIRQQTN